MVHRALDLGVTLIDTADAYGNKGGLGRISRARARGAAQGRRAGDKVWPGRWKEPGKRRCFCRLHRRKPVEASLKRLRTEWIDLYQVHFPDPKTPIEETLRALDDLVRQGKIRHIGCSNFSAKQIERGAGHGYSATSSACLSPTRMNTACSRATWNRTSSRQCKSTASACCRTSRSPAACSPANTNAARRCRRTPGSRYSSGHSEFINDRNWALVEKLDAVAVKSRPLACWSWRSAAARQADGGERDRRRHQAEQIEAKRKGERALPLRRVLADRSHHRMTNALYHRRFGRRSVRRKSAARRRLGRHRVRAQSRKNSLAAAPASPRTRSFTT